jgi:hypothetical protein
MAHGFGAPGKSGLWIIERKLPRRPTNIAYVSRRENNIISNLNGRQEGGNVHELAVICPLHDLLDQHPHTFRMLVLSEDDQSSIIGIERQPIKKREKIERVWILSVSIFRVLQYVLHASPFSPE